MNSISWFLYASDVISNLQPLFGIGGFIGLVAIGIALLAWGIEESEFAHGIAKKLPFFVFPCLLMACLIPSQKTMYAIAASQLGERAIQSEGVQGIASDATKALQIWIKKQIEPETKK